MQSDCADLQRLAQVQLHQQDERLHAQHVAPLVQALDAVRVVQVCAGMRRRLSMVTPSCVSPAFSSCIALVLSPQQILQSNKGAQVCSKMYWSVSQGLATE